METKTFYANPTITQTTKGETYKFEPISGYPRLHWKGKRPFESTQYYPAQLKEVYGEPVDGWMNKLFWGDNLQVMSHLLKDYRGKIKLIYIDPPFDSKADYKKKVTLKGKNTENDHSSFEDKQYADIWTNDEYLQFMYERLVLIRELMAEDAAIYIHCDWHRAHHLRLIADEIFGSNNFRNEIIWCYRTSLRTSAKAFGRDHDNILFFSKSDLHTIHPDKKDFPVSESTLKRWSQYADEEGFVSNKHFAGSSSTIMNTSDETKGFNINHGIPRDWWEISANVSKGNTREVKYGKYPTQKPEEIVERIIKASSETGDIVFDCFMGSGTMQAVALKHGRKFIGADINIGAVQTTIKRLIDLINDKEIRSDIKTYDGFEVFNVNHYDVFKNPIQAKELLMEALEIVPIGRSNIYDGEKDGRMVKIIPVDRVATRADLNELINNFDYRRFEEVKEASPGQPVEKVTLVCMGHEPGLAAYLQEQVDYKLDIEVVDILRDKQGLQFKRDAEAIIAIDDNKLVIKEFYPMNLLQKLSMMRENVEDWRELVESVMIDWNYDGAILEPKMVDLPGKNELVQGTYEVPQEAGTIRVKITDLLSESLEVTVSNA